MKKILLYLLLFISFLGFSQDTLIQTKTIKLYDTIYVKQTIKKIDTIIQNETRVITYDTINRAITHSEYNKLFEQTLDQKQKHYDSALNRLEWINSIIGIIITILFFIIGYFGYTSIKSIKKDLKDTLSEEIILIDDKIKTKLKEITTLKYDNDIRDINEKLVNFEIFSEEAINSFSVKKGKTKPQLKQKIETPKSTKNPFDKK